MVLYAETSPMASPADLRPSARIFPARGNATPMKNAGINMWEKATAKFAPCRTSNSLMPVPKQVVLDPDGVGRKVPDVIRNDQGGEADEHLHGPEKSEPPFPVSRTLPGISLMKKPNALLPSAIPARKDTSMTVKLYTLAPTTIERTRVQRTSYPKAQKPLIPIPQRISSTETDGIADSPARISGAPSLATNRRSGEVPSLRPPKKPVFAQGRWMRGR